LGRLLVLLFKQGISCWAWSMQMGNCLVGLIVIFVLYILVGVIAHVLGIMPLNTFFLLWVRNKNKKNEEEYKKNGE
jgi:hypothetical protein